MRKITEIIVHCSATKEGRRFCAADIDRWHKQRGWDGCGYHFVVLLDGTVEIGRPLSKVGAHTIGHNSQSIGICYIGGLDADGKPADTRTDAQRSSMRALIAAIKAVRPDITIHGHREFAAKACPCFDVDEYRDL